MHGLWHGLWLCISAVMHVLRPLGRQRARVARYFGRNR